MDLLCLLVFVCRTVAQRGNVLVQQAVLLIHRSKKNDILSDPHHVYTPGTTVFIKGVRSLKKCQHLFREALLEGTSILVLLYY